MKSLFGFIVTGAAMLLSLPAIAATDHERVRGTVTSISSDNFTVHATSGGEIPITLAADTKYLGVAKASLDNIDKGSYIGTATKNVGSMLVALEVVIFPPSMRGTGDGHYAWDKIPDTTLSHGAKTGSTMTNGNVAAVTAPSGVPAVNSTMTNGDVASAASEHGTKKLMVTYKGGEQTILVPPTAPIVTFKPGSMSELKKGATVFVIATRGDDGKLTANMVAVGTDGVTPPM